MSVPPNADTLDPYPTTSLGGGGTGERESYFFSAAVGP
jgi:hypothetical protein